MSDEPPVEPPPQFQRVWLMWARPAGSNGAWRRERVEARSAVQAEAILRRRGLEVAIESANVEGGPLSEPGSPRPIAHGRLVCMKCGYELEGLRVESSAITCPECGFPQLVSTWHHDPAQGSVSSGAQASFTLGCVIGGVAGVLLLILFLMVASSAVSF